MSSLGQRLISDHAKHSGIKIAREEKKYNAIIDLNGMKIATTISYPIAAISLVSGNTESIENTYLKC